MLIQQLCQLSGFSIHLDSINLGYFLIQEVGFLVYRGVGEIVVYLWCTTLFAFDCSLLINAIRKPVSHVYYFFSRSAVFNLKLTGKVFLGF